MKKKNITICLDVETIERLKNAAYWMPGYTISSLASDAVNEYINNLEVMNKQVAEQRNSDIKIGRKPK